MGVSAARRGWDGNDEQKEIGSMEIREGGADMLRTEGTAYCIVNLSASILAWGSESLLSRLTTIFAFVFGSESSASD